ncbi:MAG: DUF1080 domain-containing protein [Chitinophagaceae bacterium]|nr:DUF1080 domain-containing protein [Chitinophagaceae bacterium]
MRFILPSILLFLAACGSSPESTENAGTESDSSMATTTTTDSAADNTLTDAEKSEGWALLFDGQTKNGWHSYNKKGDLNDWQVENGTLTLNSKKRDFDIVTDKEYENFHFKIDWNISEGGNSGIMFGVNEAPKYDRDFYTGPEMQVLDNERHSDAKIPKHRAGDLYDLISCSTETVKPAGQWNTAEIIKNNGALEFKLNGTTVVTTTMWDDNWKKMVAGSKFKEWKDFGTFRKGVIALQDHGDKVMYKNIKLKEL